MLRPGLLLLAGGFAAQHSTALLRSDALNLLLVASICGLLSRRARLPASFVLGFVLLQLAGTAQLEAQLAPRYAGDSMLTRVRILDVPHRVGDAIVMTIAPLADPRLPRRSRVSWYESPVLPRLGEVWELELRLRRPRGSVNPGGFDYESWLFREKIHATGYVVPGPRNRLLWAGGGGALDRFRARFVERARMAAGAPEHAAVLAAIGVGARHEVSRAQWDRFAATGTSHLMAISGLHVGLAAVAGFLAAFMLAAVRPFSGNHYVMALGFGVAVACTYAIISGLGVPARRAVMMLGIATLTVVRRRQALPAANVVLAAATIYVADPVASMTPGFSLSFAAVLVLLWLARHRTAARFRALRPAGQLVVMQVFLTFGLAPLTALLFRRVAALAMPVNLLAVPVFSLVTVPLTLLAVAIGDLWEAGALAVLRVAAGSVVAVDALLVAVARQAWAHVTIAAVNGVGWLFLLLPMLWVLLPRSWPGRKAAVVGLLALLAWRPAPPPAGCVDAWVLDVGQGLAVAVQTPAALLLYDTGLAWRSGGTAAERVILPFLAARGLRGIDYLVVSHADLDHRGGAGFLREQLPLGEVLAGEPIPGLAARGCRRGMRWRSGAVRFEILHPPAPGSRAGNDASCVLRVSVGRYGLLLTGDIEAQTEVELLQSTMPLEAEVVVVPHHGSLTSSSPPFVDSVAPAVAVVSAGYGNRWGLPRPRVRARWESAGARWLNTAVDGAVHVRLCAGRGLVEIGTERLRRRRFWHAAPS